MKRCLCLSVFVALALTSTGTYASDDCAKIIATGHPQYPVIAFREGDALVGAAPTLVETIAKKLNVPLESEFMGNWADAQAAARDGKADMIYGIYYNDERAEYLDYVHPAFMYDEVVVFVAKDKAFTYTGENDLIGKKGLANKGESYGNEFDAFIKDKLDVTRTDGVGAAFKDLLAGKADYVIDGYYSGLAEAAKSGVKDQIEALSPAILEAEMFVAFSKKSPCRSLAPVFDQGITEMTTDGSFDTMLQDATTAWDTLQAKN